MTTATPANWLQTILHCMRRRPNHHFFAVFAWPAASLAAAVTLFLTIGAAHAQIGSDRYSSIVVDAGTGVVLSSANADDPRHPASLTKMMTLYLVFEALRDRRISLDMQVPVSVHAASMVPTKLGLRPGMSLSVEDAILGLITKSANDAAAALGEQLGGTEDRFAQMMTLRARALGMSRTVFRNASGLPDIEQVTTAHDLALLARHLIQDFPVEYRYFSMPSFVFHGRPILNHDPMLTQYPGADGIKTGYIEASGHNLVTSAVRNNVRLIGVVMGAATNGERNLHMAALLDSGFDQMNVPAVSRGEMQAWRSTQTYLASAQAATPMQSLAPPQTLPAVVHASSRATFQDQPVPRIRSAAHEPANLGLQVGSFTTERAAREAALTARRLAPGGDAHVEQAYIRGHPTYRAQLTGMSESELRSAVSALARHRIPAQVLPREPQHLASR